MRASASQGGAESPQVTIAAVLASRQMCVLMTREWSLTLILCT